MQAASSDVQSSLNAAARSQWLPVIEGTVVGMERSPLGRLSSLKKLWLDRTQITDQGLEELKSLKELESISVENTSVTLEGVRQLRKALPWANVEY